VSPRSNFLLVPTFACLFRAQNRDFRIFSVFTVKFQFYMYFVAGPIFLRARECLILFYFVGGTTLDFLVDSVLFRWRHHARFSCSISLAAPRSIFL
jgi:hypothetical protein